MSKPSTSRIQQMQALAAGIYAPSTDRERGWEKRRRKFVHPLKTKSRKA